MILLLDAHALLWWLTNDRKLSREARGAIADPGNDVVVSAATAWELAIKQATGKIDLPADLASALDGAGFSGLPVTIEDAGVAASLPLLHRDPFDRMLVAHARRIDATIVSRDAQLEPYGIRILPA